ncbi:MAG: hypothetical protein Q4A15_11495 [Prevotellaceae bacterium]|nr:hypothetical protein [Prevotellaceae bacterium]
MENKSICAMCKHCKKKFNAKYTSDYECKTHGTIHAITGEYTYEYCDDRNRNGDCKDFTPSWWMKLRLLLGI